MLTLIALMILSVHVLLFELLTLSPCRQEGMTSVLAAGGLLEGLARGGGALAPSSLAVQALSHVLLHACACSQRSTLPSSLQPEQQAASGDDIAASGQQAELLPGNTTRQGAAALACCQTWQVSCL